MNKEQLIDQALDVCEIKLTKKQADAFLKAVLKTIVQAVADGDKVTLVGFGTFESRERKARFGLNPRTKEKIEIPSTTAVGFSVGKDFKKAVKESQ